MDIDDPSNILIGLTRVNIDLTKGANKIKPKTENNSALRHDFPSDKRGWPHGIF
jgi:hypothetical protein